MTQIVKLQFKQGLSGGSTGWAAINPVLSSGEPGFELDTGTLKMGDGSTRWSSLNNLKNGTSIGIGSQAGQTNQGTNSIAIGKFAGRVNQGTQTIILNATGSDLNGVAGQTGSFYVAPIRNASDQGVTGAVLPLSYNTTTSEIVASGLSGTLISGSILPTRDAQFDLGSTGQRLGTIHAKTLNINTSTLVMTDSNGDNVSLSYYGGKFFFTDHVAKTVFSISSKGLGIEDYNTFYGIRGLLSTIPDVNFDIIGKTELDDQLPPSRIADGGAPNSRYYFLADGNLPRVYGYSTLGLSVLNDDTNTTTLMVDGGFVDSNFYYLADANLPKVIYY